MIFGFFLLISSFFWILNALSKEYSTSINFPARFINLPKGKILTGDLPDNVSLNIKSYGFTLLRYKLKPVLPPVKFDLRSIPYHKNPNANIDKQLFILTRYEIDKIDKQLSNDVEVEEIIPDTIYLQFTSVISKKVPVVKNLDISYHKQYLQHGNIQFKPDSILLTGPASILDTINSVYTRKKIYTEIDQNINDKIELLSFNNVKLSSKKVELFLPVEKFTEASLTIPIQIVGLPDSLNMTIFPKDFTVNYLVALSDYENVKEFMFKAVVNYNKINESLNDKLKIELMEKPDFIKSVKYYPLSVDFIIEHK